MGSNDEWFAERAWSVSANKVLPGADGTTGAVTTLAKRIEHPTSAEEIAAIVKSLPATTPIACVCGGHEASGAALVAARGAVILDLGRSSRSSSSRPTTGIWSRWGQAWSSANSSRRSRTRAAHCPSEPVPASAWPGTPSTVG